MSADMFKIINEGILVHPLFQGYVDSYSRFLKEAKLRTWFVAHLIHDVVCTVFVSSDKQNADLCFYVGYLCQVFSYANFSPPKTVFGNPVAGRFPV